MVQYVVRSVVANAHACPEELLRKNGGNINDIVYWKQFFHTFVLQWVCNK
jgi:hypothetical protein